MSDALTDIACPRHFAGEKSQSVRDQQSFIDKMGRFHGNLDNDLYSAERLCDRSGDIHDCPEGCPWEREHTMFNTRTKRCILPIIRELYGDHVIQHDLEHATNPMK